MSRVRHCDHTLKLLNAICTVGTYSCHYAYSAHMKAAAAACRETVKFRQMSSDQKDVLKSVLHSLYVDVISSNGPSRNSLEEQLLHTKPYEALVGRQQSEVCKRCQHRVPLAQCIIVHAD